MDPVNRRQFLKTAVVTAGVTIIPRHVLGGPGFVAPSDRLNIAGIGCGGQGGGDLGQMAKESNIVALCDVDWERAAKTFARSPGVPRYKDFRVMLEKQRDIDAVTVGTPDHFHAVAALAAIQLGKHVFVEKPLTHTIQEARVLARAAREARVATQMGNQGHAMESIRVLCEWIWDGAIGKVTEVHAWTPHPVWPQGMGRPVGTPPVPATLDWDTWVGPAPFRPYHPAYLPAAWRGWLDFGTGGLGDMGCHIFDHIFWSLKLGAPLSVEASSSIFVPGTMNWDKPRNTETYPQASIVTYKFPARGGFPPLTLTWYDGGLMPARPDELAPGTKMGDRYGGALYIGDKGKILTGSHGADGLRIIPEEKMSAYQRPPKTIPRSIGHYREWIEACKGGPAAGSNFDYAAPLTEIVLLGCAAVRAGEKLEWDAANMRFPNLPAADQYLTKDYRAGWKLV